MRVKTTNTYKEFCKIQRKYWRRHYPWYDRERKYHKPKYPANGILNIWVRFVVDSVEKANEVLRCHKEDGNTAEIMTTFIKYFGQPCKLWHCGTKDYEIVTLVAIEITNEDLYYVYEHKDGRRTYDTCVGRFAPITKIDEDSNV